MSAHYSATSSDSNINYVIQDNAPGFTEAIYFIDDIRDAIKPDRCAKLRFYNVMTPDGNKTTVMIGVNGKGDEINGLLTFKEYKCYRGLSNASCMVEGLSRNDAVRACDAMSNAGFASYSAQFTKESLNSMLNQATANGANAVRITPDLFNNENSMRIEPVRIEDGKATTVEMGEAGNMISTEPCPPVCGPDEYYLNR